MAEFEDAQAPERWTGDEDGGPERWSGDNDGGPDRWTGGGDEHKHKPVPNGNQFPVCIAVPVVVGRNSGQAMVVNRIPLTPPAFEVQSIDKRVEVEQCKVCTGKVIINGVLQKNIVYKTLDPESWEQVDGNEKVAGELRHCTVWIPFHMFIEVPGAEEGMDCRVESSSVECEKDELVDPTEDHSCFNTLLEKAIIRVDVKVMETRQLTVNVKDPGICP